VGPELCGWGGEAKNPYDFYRPSYVDLGKPGHPLLPADQQPACWAYDPSVEGRFKLYVASMRELLNPAQRPPKITKLDQDIVLDIGPRIFDGKEEKRLAGLTVRVPAGANAGDVGNFQHKAFIVDLIQARLHPDALQTRFAALMPAEQAQQLVTEMQNVGKAIVADPDRLVDVIHEARARTPQLWQVYSSCGSEVENDGHRFGEDLSDADKNALIAFLATL
jgi:hypothetical protein